MSSFFLYRHSEKLNTVSAEKIRGALAVYPWVKSERRDLPGAEIITTSYKSNQVRIFQDPQSRRTFILQGNIYPSSQGLKEWGNSSSLEETIIQHYDMHGIDGCAGLNGMYNLLVLSADQKIVEIATPRLHLLQIYFIPLSKDFFVITDRLCTAKYIPSYEVKIDPEGVFEMMATGKNFKETTMLQNVRRLQPNSSYKIENGGLMLLKKDRLPFSKKRWGYTLPQLIDEYDGLYKQAINRRIKSSDKVLYLQSGGKDSRIFSYFLKQCGIRPDVLTAGGNHHTEILLSRMTAQKLSFPYQSFGVSDDFESRCADQFFSINGYSTEIYGPWPMEIFSKEPAGWDTVIAGYLADAVMGNAMYLGKTEPHWKAQDYFDDYIVKQFEKYTASEDLSRLFPDYAEDSFEVYRKKAFEHFQSLGDEPYQMMIAFDLLNDDCFRLGGIIRSIHAACPVSLPHLDNDLLDFNLSLPPALLSKRLFLDAFLMKKAKYLASIPLDQNTGHCVALVPSLKDEIRYRLWEWTTKKVRLPILRLTSNYKATTQFYGQLYNLNQKGIKRLRENALQSLNLLNGLMDQEEARKVLIKPAPDNLYHVNAGNAPRSLVTILHALKYFQS